MVLDHPWFAVPDEQGRFELPPVPAGEQSITAWHERLGDTTVRVRIESGQAATADFVFRCPRSETSPRLVARTLTMTFVTVAVILSVVFVVLTLEVRNRVRAAGIGRLSLTERIFTTLEARRQQEQLATIAIVAENPP